MAPPTAMTTADNITAEITCDIALLLEVLFSFNLGHHLTVIKKGLGESLVKLHKFDVVHALCAVELDVEGCASTEETLFNTSR